MKQAKTQKEVVHEEQEEKAVGEGMDEEDVQAFTEIDAL
jgi:hypothetical protein